MLPGETQVRCAAEILSSQSLSGIAQHHAKWPAWLEFVYSAANGATSAALFLLALLLAQSIASTKNKISHGQDPLLLTYPQKMELSGSYAIAGFACSIGYLEAPVSLVWIYYPAFVAWSILTAFAVWWAAWKTFKFRIHIVTFV